MRQATDRLSVETHGPGLYEITDRVAGWVAEQRIATGLLTLFIRHTSASLTVQENADPDVRRDLADFFARIAPAEPGRYRHDAEGPDDYLVDHGSMTYLMAPDGSWLTLFPHNTDPEKMTAAIRRYLH